ncbi:EGF domain-specific O-linked N-acetylglucosamine transferase-like [Centruroides sculpturatus]|uniref:EGF domain-specific O-linked N-acetylglucosamine transferase-like n=1 Tax=Centruroides sculpturatus TaxID=218467 RepID=UPI000C6D44E8|nr:EGF domain-specific O-linked N-acetylglucosamine transferase-like [Centruroides sculpturatus]
MLLYLLFLSFIHFASLKSIWDDINLPPEHMPYFFNNNLNLASLCEKNRNCPYKKYLNKKNCWGYEKNCSLSYRYSDPICDGEAKGWVTSKKDQIHTFYTQGDFGYIKERRNELITLCLPEHPDDSLLECSKYTRFCRARNIIFHFKSLEKLPEPIRYRDDVVQKGEVGGHCKLNKMQLKKEGEHKSPLQSWFAELEHFTELPYRPIQDKKCDTVFTKPTFIMKLDAPVNMYHHFCDFLNLYASLHLNNSFTTDVFILIWDTIPYRSNFEITWKAFTKHPLLNLEQFKGKRVCFKDVVFPLLPRMIFGMYYNMPLIPGCYKSGLFHAFSKHVLHKLNIKQDEYSGKKIIITLLSRATTFRQILNENELNWD